MVKETLDIRGMICTSCEKVISKQISSLPGIKEVKVNYDTGKAEVEFDETSVSLKDIKKKIAEKGYSCDAENCCEEKSKSSWFGWLAAAAGILLLGFFGLQLYSRIPLPSISQNMGYGLILVIGLLTGLHCVAMCGGFVVSYTAKGIKDGKKPHQLHFKYALGKTLSYTIIGAIFGGIGSLITFTPRMRGFAGIIAGLFLLIFGIKMLGLFPSLNRFSIKLPSSLNRWIGKESHLHNQSPLVIGLLNGLMIACGPLQAMYILAAGTGSILEGAKILFIFGIGTLPVMLGFGYFTSLISTKATLKILKLSGLLVILLGLIMLNRGLALTGSGYDFQSMGAKLGLLGDQTTSPGSSLPNTNIATFPGGYQEIKMTVDSQGFTPNQFVLKKGVPVKWIIDGKKLNGCNNAIQVPSLDLSFKVKPGLQTIEFTPTKEGTIPWSCWMGMLKGNFIVQNEVSAATAAEAIKQAPVQKSGSCGMGCGCGMMN